MLTPASESAILAKVRKLLQLAEHGTEHEAALAAERAAELMREYGLSEAAVRVTDTAKKAEPIVTHAAEASRHDRKTVAWKGSLAYGIAAANGCCMYWVGGRIVFLGRTSAVQAADYTLSWLVPEVERITDEAWEREGQSFSIFGGAPNVRTWKHAFRIGCASRISTRLIARANERPELRAVADYVRASQRKKSAPPKELNADTPGTALAVLQKDAEEVGEEYTRRMKGARTRRGGSYSSSDGYRAGRDAGERVNLSSGPGLPAPARRLP